MSIPKSAAKPLFRTGLHTDRSQTPPDPHPPSPFQYRIPGRPTLFTLHPYAQSIINTAFTTHFRLDIIEEAEKHYDECEAYDEMGKAFMSQAVGYLKKAAGPRRVPEEGEDDDLVWYADQALLGSLKLMVGEAWMAEQNRNCNLFRSVGAEGGEEIGGLRPEGLEGNRQEVEGGLVEVEALGRVDEGGMEEVEEMQEVNPVHEEGENRVEELTLIATEGLEEEGTAEVEEEVVEVLVPDEEGGSDEVEQLDQVRELEVVRASVEEEAPEADDIFEPVSVEDSEKPVDAGQEEAGQAAKGVMESVGVEERADERVDAGSIDSTSGVSHNNGQEVDEQCVGAEGVEKWNGGDTFFEQNSQAVHRAPPAPEASRPQQTPDQHLDSDPTCAASSSHNHQALPQQTRKRKAATSLDTESAERPAQLRRSSRIADRQDTKPSSPPEPRSTRAQRRHKRNIENKSSKKNVRANGLNRLAA
ncbi:hypothetical protein BJ508DRAFT_327448 [Ascobolus immersus RN42]|uniref:Uncharacterized protein n=1 Tax=Ascobolus immersus RN42 TaxID=1160509 RepID=A0A3N4I2L5_ASCIM|nr:hypothetical protein BJ508DRAFT_327448 [Ascobolus immersus RN42]